MFEILTLSLSPCRSLLVLCRNGGVSRNQFLKSNINNNGRVVRNQEADVRVQVKASPSSASPKPQHSILKPPRKKALDVRAEQCVKSRSIRGSDSKTILKKEVDLESAITLNCDKVATFKKLLKLDDDQGVEPEGLRSTTTRQISDHRKKVGSPVGSAVVVPTSEMNAIANPSPGKIRRNLASPLQRNTYDRASVHEIRRRFQNIACQVMKDDTKSSSSIEREPKISESSNSNPVIVVPEPPAKPVRTFAHDVYVQEKQELKLLVENKYRSGRSHEINRVHRRRSRSCHVEPVYATPLKKRDKTPESSPISPIEPYHVTDIFNQESSKRIVRDIIRTSFREDKAEGCSKKSGSSEDLTDSDLSSHDQTAKVIYAKSMKKTFGRIPTVSHYASISDLCFKDTALCKYTTVYDKKNRSLKSYQASEDQTKMVVKFIRSFDLIGDHFYWFSFSDTKFIYTYCYNCEQRIISISSELFSPQFFEKILSIVVGNDIDPSITKKLVKLCKERIPLPGENIDFHGHKIRAPFDQQITTCKPSLLLRLLAPEIIVYSVSTLIQERRLVLTSGNTNHLIEGSKSIISLLYPLFWDYMFWPIVPEDLIIWCAASTTPYLIGIETKHIKSYIEALEKRGEKVLVIDLDQGKILIETGSENKILPKKSFRSVKMALSLAQNMTGPNDSTRDLAVRMAFLQLFVDVIGPITAHIGETSFSKSQFLKTSVKGKELKLFYDWFVEGRLFELFLQNWQLRCIHAKYLSPSTRLLTMGLFESRTEHFRLTSPFYNNRGRKSSLETSDPQSISATSQSYGWSSQALKMIEKRLGLASSKTNKKAFN